MKLYSLQPKKVIDEINKKGYFICDNKKSEYLIDDPGQKFNNAYNWLIDQMNKKIENPENIKFPVWAWYKIDGKNELPNFNESLLNYSDNYLIEIEIPDNEVVLSDYNHWHMPLNDIFANMEENDEKWEEINEWYDNLPYEERTKIKYDSWNVVFNVENAKYVQATFWKLNKENIVNIYEIKKSIDLDDMCDYIENDEDNFAAEYFKSRGYTKENIIELVNNYYDNYINYIANLNEKSSENLDDLITRNSIVIPDSIKEKISKIYTFFGIKEEEIINKNEI